MAARRTILFRADGNSEIGLGHLYRLFALVEMLKEDFDFKILTASNSTLDIIPDTYPVEVIPKFIETKDEPSWIAGQFLPKNHILIADGYAFKSNYQKKIKEKGFKLAYIDDLAEEHMYADLVINHSLSLQEEDYKAEGYTSFALGAAYSIVRPSFIEAAKHPKKATAISSIFICFGGADALDLTSKCVAASLQIEPLQKLNIVVGAAYNNTELLETVKSAESNCRVYQNLSEIDMLNVLQNSDLAVVPTSTISYEVCSVKMPMLGGYFVDNQKFIYDGFKKTGVIYDAGNYRHFGIEDFKDHIENLLGRSKERNQQMLDLQHQLFDGLQKERIIKLIKEIV